MADVKDELKAAQGLMDLLKDDWGSLPNSFKYCYISGLLLIGATWLIKPNGHIPRFSLLHQQHFITLQTASFLVFLFLVIALPLLFWLSSMAKICYYRR